MSRGRIVKKRTSDKENSNQSAVNRGDLNQRSVSNGEYNQREVNRNTGFKTGQRRYYNGRGNSRGTGRGRGRY